MTGYDRFGPLDLEALDTLYRKADGVVAMEDVHDGLTDPGWIGVRHDCDNVLPQAVRMAEWEAEHGHRTTYFMLHTAPYWSDRYALRRALDRIAGHGHEIGFHVNALAESVRTGVDPNVICAEGLAELRSFGHRVRGVVAHGDPDCYLPGRVVRFVNDEMFTESPRPEYGAPDRVIAGTHRQIRPVPRSMFDLEYDPNWLPRADYVSDSGGQWNKPLPAELPKDGQLHLLVHPDWWGAAFALT